MDNINLKPWLIFGSVFIAAAVLLGVWMGFRSKTSPVEQPVQPVTRDVDELIRQGEFEQVEALMQQRARAKRAREQIRRAQLGLPN